MLAYFVGHGLLHYVALGVSIRNQSLFGRVLDGYEHINKVGVGMR